jgi:hypothetical protein
MNLLHYLTQIKTKKSLHFIIYVSNSYLPCMEQAAPDMVEHVRMAKVCPTTGSGGTRAQK